MSMPKRNLHEIRKLYWSAWIIIIIIINCDPWSNILFDLPTKAVSELVASSIAQLLLRASYTLTHDDAEI